MRKALLIIASFAALAVSAQNIRLREDNIDSVLAQLTVKEKATLVVGAGWGSMFEGFRLLGCKGHRLPGAAGESRPIERCGIPSIIFADGPAGVRLMRQQMTAFPTGMALASTRDPELVYAVGQAMGEEARAVGVDVLLLPGMNLIRNPLCGRNYEYYSEDPQLSGQMAAAMIRGVQSVGVGTSAKHFALNNQETNRFHNDVIVDSVTMRDLYLENFRLVIQEAEPWTVMGAYNSINGTPAQSNPYLLTEVLRNDWNFQGAVITDWQGHQKPVQKIAAGTDLLMPGWKSKICDIVCAVKHGKLSEERLNEAAGHVLQLIVRTHTFRGDGGQPYDTIRHENLARKAGAEACVLLKNENNTLPLRKPEKIALLGVHSYNLLCGGTGSGYVNSRHRMSLDSGLVAAGHYLNPEAEQTYRTYSKKRNVLRKVTGMSLVSKYMGQPAYHEMHPHQAWLQSVVDSSDVAVVTIGRQAGEGEDRKLEKGHYYLSDAEFELLRLTAETAHAQGKKMVVVLNVADIIEMASWRDYADAILLVWTPGQEGGLAVADILTGRVQPCGKLPVTIPLHYEDVPSSANFPLRKTGRKNVRQTHYEEQMMIGHFYFDQHPEIEVAYPFGFGLTYEK